MSRTSQSSRLVAVLEQAVISAMSLIASVTVGRFCGMDTLASYALAWTILTLLIGVQTSVVGMPYTVRVHDIDRNAVPKYRGASLVNLAILIAIGVAITATMTLVFFVLGGRELALALGSVALSLPFIMTRDLTRRWALAHFQPTAALWLTMVVASTQAMLLFLAVQSHALNAATAIVCLGAGSGIACLAWWFLQARPIELDWASTQQLIHGDWMFGRWMLAHQVASLLHVYCVLWLAEALVPTETGVLAVYVTLSSLSNPVFLGVMNSVTPHFAAAKSPASRSDMLRKTTLLLASVMVVFCALYVGMGQSVAQLLYDNASLADRSWLVVFLGLRVLVASLGVAPHIVIVTGASPYRSSICVLIGLAVSCSVAVVAAPVWALNGLVAAWFLGMAVETIAFRISSTVSMQEASSCTEGRKVAI